MKRLIVLGVWMVFALSLVACTVSNSTTASSLVLPTLDEVDLTTSYENHPEDNHIVFSEQGISTSSSDVIIDGRLLTIQAAGIYYVSGTSSDAQIVIGVEDDEDVILVLENVDLTSAIGPVLIVSKADKVILNLAAGSNNFFSDQTRSSSLKATVIQSEDDFTINGSGSLTIHGEVGDGINTDDSFVLNGGNLTIHCVKDGIQANDAIVVADGNLEITSGKDALHAEYDDALESSLIYVMGGNGSLRAFGDGMDSSGELILSGGSFEIYSGLANTDIDATSAKGLKAGCLLQVDGGSFLVVAVDDALHSDGALVLNQGMLDLTTNQDGIQASEALTINDGTLDIAAGDDAINGSDTVHINGGSIAMLAGDDAIHSDTMLGIAGGTIVIESCYEGIEAQDIAISGGIIELTSQDDGINAVDSSSSSAFAPGGPMPIGKATLAISGGSIYVNSLGDGVDVNGSMTMSDGLLLISGPTANNNGPIDYDGTFLITGGTVIATGSSGMTQNISTSSTQCGVLINFTSIQSRTVRVEDESGNEIATFTPAKAYQSLLISSQSLHKNQSYRIYLGGTITDAPSVWKGRSIGGSYAGGSLYQSFSIAAITTTVGSSSIPHR